MFNITVFPDFSAAGSSNVPDRLFLAELCAVRETLGARFVNFSVFDYHKENPDSVHFLTYPMDWIKTYVSQCYTGIDPLLKVDYRRVAHADWRAMLDGDDRQAMFDRFVDSGLGNQGITLSAHAKAASYGALSLVFRCQDDRWDALKQDRMADFRFEAERLTERYCELYEAQDQTRRGLTDREREVLRLVALGMTDEQIGKAIGIGKWTVVSHLQSAKFKLGSCNRASAVAIAITRGLIDLRNDLAEAV